MYLDFTAGLTALPGFFMKYFIVVNAYIKNKSQIAQAARIEEELKKSGADVQIVKNISLATIKDGKIVSAESGVGIFLDKDKVAARMLESCGIKLYNSAAAIEVCDDKMLTHIALSQNGIPTPDCVYAPLCYYADAEISEQLVDDVIKKLALPVVAKTCYGSLGAGVSLLRDRAEIEEYERNNKLIPHFYQKFIGIGGADIRVIVIGGRYVCAMRRINKNDFRSNIEQGGRGEKYEADSELIELCEKTSRSLSLDYCGIDVLIDEDGKRYVCEVNSNAFFAEAERVCGVNIAKKYAEFIISRKNA